MTDKQAIIIAAAIIIAGLLNGGVYERQNDYNSFNKFTGNKYLE